MEIIIGVESSGTVTPQGTATPPVLALLERMDFPEAKETLLHVVPPVATSMWNLDPLLGGEEVERCEQLAVARAEEYIASLIVGTEAESKVVVGQPAGTMLSEAKQRGVDIIAVNASGQGTLEALFTGSVARALVAGTTKSVLLARPTETVGSLRVVLATDHSGYMDSCVEALAQMAPRGIGHLTILTVYPELLSYTYTEPLSPSVNIRQSEIAYDASDNSVGGETHPTMEERSQHIIEKLRGALGSPETVFDTQVIPGKPSEIITQAMLDTKADLLILGAKGHSVIERLVLGSVSFDQAIGQHPYSVLILRI
jgi:nucleotide-binding universal stress UspA family protein